MPLAVKLASRCHQAVVMPGQKVTFLAKKTVQFAQRQVQIFGVQRYTGAMKSTSDLRTFVAAFFCMAFAAVASAQWQWIGKDGRKVFSDQSPPAEIQEKDILKRPGGSVRSSAPVAVNTAGTPAVSAAGKPASAASAPTAKASAPKVTGKDAELEAKKKKAEEEQAEKKKAEEEKVAKTKAENCARAKNGLATLKSGVRMASRNDKGETEVFDDAKRASESKRAQEIIDSSCS